MVKILLTPAQRKPHRAAAHHLDPVVLIGADGLTPAVVAEVDTALKAHGLIKVRAASDDRGQREQWLETLADRLGAAPIQHIGKLLVLWRPLPQTPKPVAEDRKPGPRHVKVVDYGKRPGQKPTIKVLRVLGNQRLTQGGRVKRARTQPVSIKKRTLGG